MGKAEWWRYEYLPTVHLHMNGGLTGKYDEDDSKRSHFQQDFIWRIDQDTDEFVIRITRKPEAARHGHTNVAVRIEGGLSEQADGSVVFDGGVGNGHGNGVSTFGLSFKISHEEEKSEEKETCGEEDTSAEEETWGEEDTSAEEETWGEEDISAEEETWGEEDTSEEEEPEEKEVAFFDHSEHKLLLDPVNFYKDMPGSRCSACMEPNLERARWVYRCPVAACDYAVHAACAKLPRIIRHPCHPKHTVKLLKLSSTASRQCDVCYGSIPQGLHYQCAKCDFDAHAMCPQPRAETAEVEGEQELDQTSQYSNTTQQQYLAYQEELANQQLQRLTELRLQRIYCQNVDRITRVMLAE